MRKEITRSTPESRIHLENLKKCVRGQVRRLIQELLEEECLETNGCQEYQ